MILGGTSRAPRGIARMSQAGPVSTPGPAAATPVASKLRQRELRRLPPPSSRRPVPAHRRNVRFGLRSLCCDGAAYAGGQRTTPCFAMNVAMASCSGVSCKTVMAGLFLGRKFGRGGAPYRRAGKMLIGAAVNTGTRLKCRRMMRLMPQGIRVKRAQRREPRLADGAMRVMLLLGKREGATGSLAI
jgi:hypothetical protein